MLYVWRKDEYELNYKNDNCHRRMVKCVVCSGTFHNTCSDACKTRIVRMRYNRILRRP